MKKLIFKNNWQFLQLKRIAFLLLMFGTSLLCSEVNAISGSGTESDPYLLSNSADMNTFKQRIEGGAPYFYNYWKLTQDIYWTGSGGTNNRIGYNGCPFTGTFDGGGFKVKIDYIENSLQGYNGFFGQAINCIVKDFTFEYKVINSGYYGAGLIGEAKREVTIDNVHVIGTEMTHVHGGRWGGLIGVLTDPGKVNISSCSVNISEMKLHETGTEGYFDVGGLIGVVNASSDAINISDCIANVKISLDDANSTKVTMGGLIGFVGGTVNITRCFVGTNIPGELGSKYHRGSIILNFRK